MVDARIRTKHVADPPHPDDGRRYFVDRKWPAKLRKSEAALDGWWHELAPSEKLWNWWSESPEKFAEFSLKFRLELLDVDEAIDRLAEEAERGTVTLLHTAQDDSRSAAAVVAGLLRERLAARRRGARRSAAPAPAPSPPAPPPASGARRRA